MVRMAQAVLENHPDLGGIMAFNTISTQASWAAIHTYPQDRKSSLSWM